MYTRDEIAMKCGTMISLVAQMDASCKFDNKMASNFASNKWDDRQDALQELTGAKGLRKWKLKHVQPPLQQECFEHLTAIVLHCMEDKVRPVCLSAMECFSKIIEVFAVEFKRTAPEEKVLEQFTKTVHYLLHRMGDSNTKVKDAAKNCLMDVVHLQHPRGIALVWRAILRQGEKKEGASGDMDACQRLMILHTLVTDCGFSKKDGLTLSSVMSLAVPALAIADQKTRNAAMDVVVAAYAASGERVNKHITGCKPAMVKILRRKFQELHDQELFGGDAKQDALKDVKEAKKKAMKAKQAAAARSNQQSPGASEEEGSDDDEAADEEWATIPPALSGKEGETALNAAVELLNGVQGLGVVLIHKLRSDKWSDRKEAFDQLTEWASRRETELIEAVKQNPTDTTKAKLCTEFGAHLTLLLPAIQQNVMPVVMSACTCLRKLLRSYASVCNWRDNESCAEMHGLIPALLEKTGGTNQRVQREACKCLLELCRANHGAGLQRMVPHLLKAESSARPTTANPNGRPATSGAGGGKNVYKNMLRAKLIMLKLLVKEFGLRSSKGGFGCGVRLRELMRICCTALDEADSKTRKAGISVIVEVEKIVGKERVIKHLEDVKPATLQKVMQKIDPTAVKKTAAKRALPALAAGSSGVLEPLKRPVAAGNLESVADPFVLKGKPLMKPPHHAQQNAHQALQALQMQQNSFATNPMDSSMQSMGGQSMSMDQSVARSIDFSSEIMEADEERFMSSILDNAPGYVF
jgi:hypothetical protein